MDLSWDMFEYVYRIYIVVKDQSTTRKQFDYLTNIVYICAECVSCFRLHTTIYKLE